MTAEQYCNKYGKELLSGRISFYKKDIDRFIKVYTHLDITDFSFEMYKRLRLYMIDLYTIGSSFYYFKNEYPAEKIILPDFVLCVVTK